MKSIFVAITALTALALAGNALAKLPAPSDEAKAKAAEAAAKAAHAGKLDAFQLCKAQDRVAARTNKAAKPAAKDVKDTKAAAAPASGCVDPGPFVYTPAAPASAAVPAASAAPAPVPVTGDKAKK